MEPNCLGIEILDNIVVDIVYPDGRQESVELQIEPEIIMHGQASTLAPGVTWNPAFYLTDEGADVAETIAYGINEGGVTSDTIEREAGDVVWSVRSADVAVLRRHGIIRD